MLKAGPRRCVGVATGLEDAVDFERLEGILKVLSYARRLELLSRLRSPHAVADIRLAPGLAQAGGSPDRTMSRQAVENHLNQLVENGFVRLLPANPRRGRPANQYVTDHPSLFALVEDLRRLSALRSVEKLDPSQTIAAAPGGSQAWAEGPKVVLVHGSRDGQAFPLRSAALHGSRGWIIGRKSGAHVELDYDPFVSSENSEIVKRGAEFRLLDLRTARNGTSLNWRRLPVGGEEPLHSGDIVGVGRSLLVFREH